MRIAWCSPMADRSAIASKSELIVDALRTFSDVEVDVWFPPTAGGRSHFAGQREMVPSCEAALERYDAVVYCIGDYGRYHARILEAAWRVPGIVALHDVSLSNLFYDMAVVHGIDWLRRQIRWSAGGAAEDVVLSRFAQADGWPGDPYVAGAVPMLGAALRGGVSVCHRETRGGRHQTAGAGRRHRAHGAGDGRAARAHQAAERAGV